ncbi:hypothetical protein T08_7321 [Trichinella sp. T8]|uniref:Uncharacterized protein n=1 Tax=Trichinella murrelli TaxID=144512 RepID=A0A0V0T335_9BILA|nr:hypothetical protein T05_5508 [Trichinella murrelli]KRX34272.1 hypothetical protein T05_11434 [Trichinella murrelli]KRZ81719.1 hypothetical protein T08_7321 [Trichinella sp. T8]
MALRSQWKDSQIFCRGLELHIKRDGSQPKGGANLVKSHVSSLISKGSAFVVATGKLYLLINLTFWLG